jgi:hypothetical protein
MKIGSLFTGYGGLDTAIGGELAWYAEIDKAACEVLAHHYPGVPNLGDITMIDWTQVEPVDVLTGGYPCQPFSHAGLRKGKNDDRHLWPYVRDAIHTLRPEYAVLENVSGPPHFGICRCPLRPCHNRVRCGVGNFSSVRCWSLPSAGKTVHRCPPRTRDLGRGAGTGLSRIRKVNKTCNIHWLTYYRHRQ